MSDAANNKSQDRVETTMSPKQLIGAAVGIVALLGLLFIGRTFSTTKQAELLVNQSAPTVATYESDAAQLDPFDAAGGEYEIGQPVMFETSLETVLEEPVVGAANVVVEMSNEAVQSQSDKSVSVVLVFADEENVPSEGSHALVMGRYIGAVDLEGELGGSVNAPAIQVDHVRMP